MQMAWCLHAVKRVAVCGMCMLGSLILLGCGDDASSSDGDAGASASGGSGTGAELSAEALLVAQAPYYAALDAAFPEGKPGVTSVEERSADAAYTARLTELTQQKVTLEMAAAEARKTADYYKGVQLGILQANLGEEPLPEVLEARLAKDDRYRELDAAAKQAEAAVAAKQAEVAAVIRARQLADITRYSELKAAADTAAQAAGLPVRVESRAPVVVKESTDAPKPSAGIVDVKDLSEETGIPIAPSAP